MTRTITAEYLADEQKLKLEAPLEGVEDHESVQIAVIVTPSTGAARPWMSLEGSLPADLAEEWRANILAETGID